MRAEFVKALLENFEGHDNLVLVSGDLGYRTFEAVQEKLGDRFINAGVAEQNMITISAALAHEGFLPVVYSISPFATLRPYEQIRNDICLHNLPVKLVGNGGGYGYGILGPSHHSLEDIAVMRVLPNMKVYVPFTSSDVGQAVQKMLNNPSPNYLRLNLGAKIQQQGAPFAQWRKFS